MKIKEYWKMITKEINENNYKNKELCKIKKTNKKKN